MELVNGVECELYESKKERETLSTLETGYECKYLGKCKDACSLDLNKCEVLIEEYKTIYKFRLKEYLFCILSRVLKLVIGSLILKLL